MVEDEWKLKAAKWQYIYVCGSIKALTLNFHQRIDRIIAFQNQALNIRPNSCLDRGN